MPNEAQKQVQVAILGGGITGSAIFYTLCHYSNLKSIALIEKHAQIGHVNSRGDNNSQTLHFGDIETNYSLEKAKKTKAASELVVKLLKNLGEKAKDIFAIRHKMALAVGQAETEQLRARYQEFLPLFPELKLYNREQLAAVEPEIVKGRPVDEELLAFYSDQGYVVDFGKLSQVLIKEAKQAKPQAEILLNTEVITIKKEAKHFIITTNTGTISADTIVVAMCAHSLMFAKQLDYGHHLGILPVGGNFFTAQRKVLNGKVYTMQSGKLPFAAVHGDPVLGNETHSRFGPTSTIMPLLERRQLKTFFEFIKSSANTPRTFIALLKVIFERTLFPFLWQSLVYELPYFGERSFSRLAKKIVPTLTDKDLKNGKSKAGIRPQLIDVKTGKLLMGETEIVGDKILFQITPSPGATSCMANARDTAKKIAGFFGDANMFDEAKFKTDFEQ